ncbi:hypothetical protein [Streptomyces sp. NBC_00624]|uniref:hypothetical protein n=1 Tax=Streptomyces sp. NBC_00624 TaxID=2975791 RepID=UPI0030E25D8D
MNPDVASLREHLSGRVGRRQLPERRTFIEGVPRAGVGKFGKKQRRARYVAGELAVQEMSGGGQVALSRWPAGRPRLSGQVWPRSRCDPRTAPGSGFRLAAEMTFHHICSPQGILRASLYAFAFFVVMV